MAKQNKDKTENEFIDVSNIEEMQKEFMSTQEVKPKQKRVKKIQPKEVEAKQEEKNKVGRQIEWTEDRKKNALDIIFTEIAEKGCSVRSILDNADRSILPSNVTFCEWLSNDNDLAKQYAYVKRLGIELKFQSIEQDYSENPRLDPETGRIDTGWVQLQRLKIDSKKWELSKLMPKVYGDKIEVDSTIKGEITNNVIDYSKLSTDTLNDLLNNSQKND